MPRPRRKGDGPDWSGVSFESVNVGTKNKPAKWRHNGYQYCTAGEHRLAKLLEKQGIPFTPDVAFILDDFGRERPFVVDFIFDKGEYEWTGGGRKQIIHGIEAKGKILDAVVGPVFKPRALENVQMLKEQRNINVLLLTNASIRVYSAWGRLPLRMVKPPRTK